MENSALPDGFYKRLKEAAELSKYMLQYGNREEMLGWGIRSDIVDAIIALRKFDSG